MKKGIHPDYKPTTIVCSCGNRIETRSTRDEIHVEICAVCHPFYTGRQKLVDTAGRVERFKRKWGAESSSSAGEEAESEEAETEEAESEESGPEAAAGNGEEQAAEKPRDAKARKVPAAAGVTEEAGGSGGEEAEESASKED